jgi:putative transposase
MRIVKQIQVKKSNPFFAECDRLCFASKNLYNQALYRVNKAYEADKIYLNYNAISKELADENQVDYRGLPSKVAQQTLMLLDKSYKSFFAALKAYKTSPEKFKARPQPPQYKHKTKGRFVTTFTIQAISSKELKRGFLKLSGSTLSIKTELETVNQVRIVPNKVGSFTLEIIYEIPDVEKVNNANYAGIDMGLNNLAAIVTNIGSTPILINGKPLKAINQFYNKKLAQLKSKLPHYVGKDGKKRQRTSCKSIKILTHKRNNKIKDYLHKSSRKVVNHLQQNNISVCLIGQNKDWKQAINIGKRNNQNFVAIPQARFIDMISYKNDMIGIRTQAREESYTSKCSFLDNEPIRKHEQYAGKPIKRGLFMSKNGLKINADINGAANILRKEIPNAFAEGIEGVLVRPLKLGITA